MHFTRLHLLVTLQIQIRLLIKNINTTIILYILSIYLSESDKQNTNMDTRKNAEYSDMTSCIMCLSLQKYFLLWLSSFCFPKIHVSQSQIIFHDVTEAWGWCLCVCALVYRKAHRQCIVGQPRNNTADCFPLTKKVWFLIVKRGRFTACGFKRLETEAILRESAAH